VVNRGQQSVEVLSLTPKDASTVGVYRRGETMTSIVFPGLALAVADIFAV
jgi:Uma2 family endonuclease